MGFFSLSLFSKAENPRTYTSPHTNTHSTHCIHKSHMRLKEGKENKQHHPHYTKQQTHTTIRAHKHKTLISLESMVPIQSTKLEKKSKPNQPHSRKKKRNKNNKDTLPRSPKVQHNNPLLPRVSRSGDMVTTRQHHIWIDPASEDRRLPARPETRCGSLLQFCADRFVGLDLEPRQELKGVCKANLLRARLELVDGAVKSVVVPLVLVLVFEGLVEDVGVRVDEQLLGLGQRCAWSHLCVSCVAREGMASWVVFVVRGKEEEEKRTRRRKAKRNRKQAVGVCLLMAIK